MQENDILPLMVVPYGQGKIKFRNATLISWIRDENEAVSPYQDRDHVIDTMIFIGEYQVLVRFTVSKEIYSEPTHVKKYNSDEILRVVVDFPKEFNYFKDIDILNIVAGFHDVSFTDYIISSREPGLYELVFYLFDGQNKIRKISS